MLSFFFFNDTATTEIYTLSLHDALPISLHASAQALRSPQPAPMHRRVGRRRAPRARRRPPARRREAASLVCPRGDPRSEEHTSELQSQSNLVCRLLLEKKKWTNPTWSLP